MCYIHVRIVVPSIQTTFSIRHQQEEQTFVSEILHSCRQVLINAIFAQAKYRLNAAYGTAQGFLDEYNEMSMASIAANGMQKKEPCSELEWPMEQAANANAVVQMSEEESMAEVTDKMDEVMLTD